MWGSMDLYKKNSNITKVLKISIGSRDAEYFDFFMYSLFYSFADQSTPNPLPFHSQSTPNPLLKSIYSKNRHIKLESTNPFQIERLRLSVVVASAAV